TSTTVSGGTVAPSAFTAGIITTVAGSSSTSLGDGGPATSAGLGSAIGVAFDSAGNMYVADWVGDRIRRVSPSGTISTFAGTGSTGFSGDGGQAVSAMLSGPSDVAVDSSGNVYIADTDNHR